MKENTIKANRGDQKCTDRQWLPQFQGLRAVAFGAIFISHLGIGNFGALGAWGVSVFLVLSGFLMVNSYWFKANQCIWCCICLSENKASLPTAYFDNDLCCAFKSIFYTDWI